MKIVPKEPVALAFSERYDSTGHTGRGAPMSERLITLIGTVTTLLGMVAFAAAVETEPRVYGNQAGCSAYRGEDSGFTDSLLFVTPSEIHQWESRCALTDPTYDGRPMRVVCHGEGEEWETAVSLLIKPEQPDVMVYGFVGGSRNLSACGPRIEARLPRPRPHIAEQTSGQKGKTTCHDGAIFETKETSAQVVILQLGKVRARFQIDGPLLWAHALKMRMTDGTIAYGWGPMRSYTFSTTAELLHRQSVEWNEVLEVDDNTFFRFMDDYGKIVRFTIYFARCR